MQQNPSRSIGFKLLILCLFSCGLLSYHTVAARQKNTSLHFTVTVKDTAAHLYSVVLECSGFTADKMLFKLPVWTPGYYQLMNYAENIENFSATSKNGNELAYKKTGANSWEIVTAKANQFTVSYDVKATRPFVAANYLDGQRGYISPAGVFIHPAGKINHPVTVSIKRFNGWSVASGMDTIKGRSLTYTAPDYDILYDSPILMGHLEKLPSFTVKGIPHHFVAFKPGEFAKDSFMQDLKKIITTASSLIGDIPYNHYTFLAIGPGGGGIEHLNSTSISFSGNGLRSREAKINIYNFLTHEYFHHYNVKRIRPVELGPFDYDNGSRTNMLWLSEGVTVYYEYVIMKRAGITTADEMLKTYQNSIRSYESKPGRHFQTPADASYNTWAEGPFGRTTDEVNKTISPYDKGPALGLLLDFKIRHETKNKYSFDDLMRLLYNNYYKKLKRGFSEEEFRKEAEKMAGVSLSDFFDYIYTLKQVDYPTYLGYAGLAIDTVAREKEGAWTGAVVRDRNDSLTITNVEWQSPAWEAGLRNRQTILQVNGKKMTAKNFTELLNAAAPGDKITIRYLGSNGEKEAVVTTRKKKESSYAITRIANPTPLQAAILKSWMGEE